MNSIPLEYYLILSFFLFSLGSFGIFWGRKNIITMLMALEIVLLAININFVAFASFQDDLVGQIFTIFILTVAAAEAAIGLAILVIYERNKGSIDVQDMTEMKG